MCNLLVFCLLLGGKFATTRLLVWHRDFDILKREADKAQVLQQLTAFGQPLGPLISNRLVVAAAFVGIAQKRNLAHLVAKQHIFHAMTLFLAAIIRLLLSIVVGASDWAFGTIVIKSGAVSAAASGCTSASRSRKASK
jgi:hypothetical protein